MIYNPSNIFYVNKKFFFSSKYVIWYVPEVLNVHVNGCKKKSTVLEGFFLSSEKLTLEKKMWFF